MQRIRVDLPEPDGPHRTIFSPARTARLMSVSAWKAPYHLSTPCIAIIVSAVAATGMAATDMAVTDMALCLS